MPDVRGQVEYAFELIAWLVKNLHQTGKEDEAKEIAQILKESISGYVSVYGASEVSSGNE